MSREARATGLACLWAGIAGALMPWPALWLAERIAPSLDGYRALVVLPLLLAAPVYPAWIHRVRHGALCGAVLCALTWAVASSVVTIGIFRQSDEEFAGLVWNAIQYRHEMFDWLATGVGQESDPSLFVPLHALHFAAFAAASLVSVGFLGLVLGAALLGYMNFYVAALMQHATDPWTIVAFGWPVYAIVRVIGFVCVGTGLAAVALNLVGRAGIPWRGAVRTIAVGVALVLLDLVLKATVAPWYREVLAAATTR